MAGSRGAEGQRAADRRGTAPARAGAGLAEISGAGRCDARAICANCEACAGDVAALLGAEGAGSVVRQHCLLEGRLGVKNRPQKYRSLCGGRASVVECWKRTKMDNGTSASIEGRARAGGTGFIYASGTAGSASKNCSREFGTLNLSGGWDGRATKHKLRSCYFAFGAQ